MVLLHWIGFFGSVIDALFVAAGYAAVGLLVARHRRKQTERPALWKALAVAVIGLFAFTIRIPVMEKTVQMAVLPLGVWILYLFLRRKNWPAYRGYAWIGFAANFVLAAMALLAVPADQGLYPKESASTYVAGTEEAAVIRLHPLAPAAEVNAERLKQAVERSSLAEMDAIHWYMQAKHGDLPEYEPTLERFPYQLTGTEPRWGSGISRAVFVEEDGMGLLVTTASRHYYFRSDIPFASVEPATASRPFGLEEPHLSALTPAGFPDDRKMVETINRTYAAANAKEALRPIALDGRHAYAPFISDTGRYGSSYWIRKGKSWTIARIDSDGDPYVWKLDQDDPSTHYVVWSFNPEKELSKLRLYLMRDRNAYVSDSRHYYTPMMQLQTEIDVRESPYGVMRFPADWREAISESAPKADRSWSDLLLSSSRPPVVTVMWNHYNEDGEESFPIGSEQAGFGFTKEDIAIEPVYIVNERNLLANAAAEQPE